MNLETASREELRQLIAQLQGTITALEARIAELERRSSAVDVRVRPAFSLIAW